MQVFKYWHTLDKIVHDNSGRPYDLRAWGGSLVSAEDAQEKAAAKLRRWIAALARGESLGDYEYQAKELREELVEEIHGASGELIGAVTRNRYGALVLNSASMLIADLDAQRPSFFTKLLGLFGRKLRDKDYRLRSVQDFVEARSGCGAVVYETHSGLRAIFTHQPFDPAGDESQGILTTLGSDPLYRRLCTAQSCYRARLTPKPWRCASPRPPNKFPRTTDEDRAAFDRWLVDYEKRAAKYSVCRLLETFGARHVIDDARTLLAAHDKVAVYAGGGNLA